MCVPGVQVLLQQHGQLTLPRLIPSNLWKFHVLRQLLSLVMQSLCKSPKDIHLRNGYMNAHEHYNCNDTFLEYDCSSCFF